MPIVMHVDMDAFYASVELRRRPELRGRPMWVGGEHRGVVLSATYEARAYGVSGGMPTTRARRLCRDAVAIAPDFDAYQEVSEGVFAIFDTVTPVVEPVSVDEAFLDITGARRLWGEPRDIGAMLRAKVRDEQGIPCSVGIGPTKFIAKLASTQAKPDGMVEVKPSEVIAFLHPLPVERMWGVGDATAAILHKLGLRTIGDLAYAPRSTLQRTLGAHAGSHLHDLAWGIDARRVVARERERSVGSQETFGKDVADLAIVEDELLRLSARVAARMRAASVFGRTVTVSVRFSDFRTIEKSLTLRSPTDTTGDVHVAAVRALHALRLERPRVRRVGVRVTGLVDIDHAYQQPMLGEPDRGWREAETAADAAVYRFGPRAVQRATLTRRRVP